LRLLIQFNRVCFSLKGLLPLQAECDSSHHQAICDQ
jgi:hypothetical protein